MSASESLVLNNIYIISAVKMAFTSVGLYSTYLGVLSVEAYQFIVNFQSDSFDLFVLMCTSLGFILFLFRRNLFINIVCNTKHVCSKLGNFKDLYSFLKGSDLWEWKVITCTWNTLMVKYIVLFKVFVWLGLVFLGFVWLFVLLFFDSSFTDMLLLFKLKQNVCFKTSWL